MVLIISRKFRPEIIAFNSSSIYAIAGRPVILTWQIEGAFQIRISECGFPVTHLNEFAVVVKPDMDKVTIKARGILGTVSKTINLHVVELNVHTPKAKPVEVTESPKLTVNQVALVGDAVKIPIQGLFKGAGSTYEPIVALKEPLLYTQKQPLLNSRISIWDNPGTQLLAVSLNDISMAFQKEMMPEVKKKMEEKFAEPSK